MDDGGLLQLNHCHACIHVTVTDPNCGKTSACHHWALVCTRHLQVDSFSFFPSLARTVSCPFKETNKIPEIQQQVIRRYAYLLFSKSPENALEHPSLRTIAMDTGLLKPSHVSAVISLLLQTSLAFTIFTIQVTPVLASFFSLP